MNKVVINKMLIVSLIATIASAVLSPSLVFAPVYRSHIEQSSMFKTLCDQHSEVSYEVIGQTYEGRDIIICKFGNPNGGAVMWDGALHGWEDVGTEVMYLLAEWLLTSDDQYASRIMQHNYVLFIPVVNVDSEVRENRNFEYSPYGVDLNRNFKSGWTYTSRTRAYHGDYAASEPETQAVRNAMSKFRPVFYVNTHIGGSYIIYDRNGNMEDVDAFSSRYTQLASEMGVSKYSVGGGGGGYGLAYGDAKEFGGTGFLWEMVTVPSWSDKPSLSQIENEYYPRAKAVLAAMCRSCESDVPLPPPPAENGTLNAKGYFGGNAVQCQAYYTGPEGTSELFIVPSTGCTWNNLTAGTYTVYGTYHGLSTDVQVTVSSSEIAYAQLDFNPFTYYLTITSTTGGTTDPLPGTYNYTAGSSSNVTAIPNPGYLFDHWLLDGEEKTENPITIVTDANHTSKAFFRAHSAPEVEVEELGEPELVNATNPLIVNTTEEATLLVISEISDPITIVVETVEEPEGVDSPPRTWEALGTYVQITVNNTDIALDAKISMRYTLEQLEVCGLDESTLGIRFWNAASGEWEPIESHVNTEEHFVCANIDHFNLFSIMGQPSGGAALLHHQSWFFATAIIVIVAVVVTSVIYLRRHAHAILLLISLTELPFLNPALPQIP